MPLRPNALLTLRRSIEWFATYCSTAVYAPQLSANLDSLNDLLDVGGCQVLRGFSAYACGFLLKIYLQTLLLKAVFGLEQCLSSHHIRILLFFLRFFC